MNMSSQDARKVFRKALNNDRVFSNGYPNELPMSLVVGRSISLHLLYRKVGSSESHDTRYQRLVVVEYGGAPASENLETLLIGLTSENCGRHQEHKHHQGGSNQKRASRIAFHNSASSRFAHWRNSFHSAQEAASGKVAC
jgi:hypothetical protein